MLKLVIGTDWTANRRLLLSAAAQDVAQCKGNRVILVPEYSSHDMERHLSAAAGDTASRFAEVLSFTRLARRVADDAGHSSAPCLDEGGRVVAMAAAIFQVKSKLKFFASFGTRPEFISNLVETVDECKRCCVDSGCLMRASKETTGTTAQKLEELSLLLEAYDAICSHGKKDPQDQLTWLLEELESGNYAQEHVFYIDGFADFTRQQIAILEHLIRYSKEVTITLCCDKPGSTALAFERPGETAIQIQRIARKNGIAYDIIQNDIPDDVIGKISTAVFEGDTQIADSEYLSVSCFESVFQECESVAESIHTLVQSGARYRDISIICPSISDYEGPLSMTLQRCGIPAYISGTQNILDRPVIATLLSAMDAAANGYERKDIIGYLKTALSPLSLSDSDLIENYAIMWGISGSKWTQPWTMHPRGLVTQWSEEDHALLAHLNALREQVMVPIAALHDGIIGSDNVAGQTNALYRFMEDIRLPQRLSALSDKLECNGDLRGAQVLDQLWEIIVNALEQLHDALGRSIWNADSFGRLFRILLSQYDVGTIPTVLDSVTVGAMNTMRCKQTPYLFVLGAVEGSLPAYSCAAGVLSDQDRTVLRDLGVPLNGGAADSLQTTFSEIYCVFRGATKSIFVSYPGGQPSFVYLRLKAMCTQEHTPQDVLGAAFVNRKHAAAFLLRSNDYQTAQQLELSSVYDALDQKRRHVHGWIAKEQVEKLYGKQFKLSASQIDVHANCAMSYFLKYGLCAKERKAAEVDPAEFGTFVHDVLEKTGRKIVSLGGFKAVSKEQTLQIAADYAKDYAQEHFSDLDSQRTSYLFNRNGKELVLVVEELWNELRSSSFDPVMFELSFGGENADFPPIYIQGNTACAKLRGFVDRVDVWNTGKTSYYRVVDYKTGVKAFDYCDVVNGIGLQMLLYLFALKEADSDLLGADPVPAGVQYFPARAPVISVACAVDENAAVKERDLAWKRSGLLLGEDTVLSAMEPEDMPSRMPFKRKKDGSLSGDLADRQQFELLRKFVYGHLQSMVDDIASGNVSANPYTRDARKNACRFCPYGEVCHKNEVSGRRVYKAINADRFWEDVKKEVTGHG